jgi:cytochrome c553
MDLSRGKALATYREEAKKCVLVCANCHGEIEAGLIESPPAGARYRGRLKAA